jgi:hypothetical protein
MVESIIDFGIRHQIVQFLLEPKIESGNLKLTDFARGLNHSRADREK